MDPVVDTAPVADGAWPLGEAIFAMLVVGVAIPFTPIAAFLVVFLVLSALAGALYAVVPLTVGHAVPWWRSWRRSTSVSRRRRRWLISATVAYGLGLVTWIALWFVGVR